MIRSKSLLIGVATWLKLLNPVLVFTYVLFWLPLWFFTVLFNVFIDLGCCGGGSSTVSLDTFVFMVSIPMGLVLSASILYTDTTHKTQKEDFFQFRVLEALLFLTPTIILIFEIINIYS